MAVDEDQQDERIANIYSRLNRALNEYDRALSTLDADEWAVTLLRKLNEQGLTVTLEVEAEGIGMRWQSETPDSGD